MTSLLNTIKMNAMVIGGRTRNTNISSSLAIPKTIKMSTLMSRRSVSPLVVSMVAVFLVSSSYSSVRASSAEYGFVKKTISSNKIVIFSKSYCPYCQRAKAVFKELNQSPHIIELDERDDGHSVQDAVSEMVGRRTVPQVFVNGKHIGGSDDTIEAYESGELAKLLGVAKEEL